MATNGTLETTLAGDYFDPSNPVSYSGARSILAKYKGRFPEEGIKNWLNAQNTYTLHKPIRYKFPRMHYNVSHIDQVWEADLVDLRSLKSYNQDIVYLLVVIDVLSKYAWVEPLRNKTANEVLEAFKRIFKQSNHRIPLYIQTDRGKEFVGSVVQKFLSENNIQFRVSRNPDIKAAVVERFNRTLKERMWRYFTYKKTYKYMDVLQKIVDAYNHTTHTSTKMKPVSVTRANDEEAWDNIRKRYKVNRVRGRPFKYRVGDYVRISKAKAAFQKGYEGNWTEELFQIKKNYLRQNIPIYELKDLSDGDIDGFFYERELTLVNKNIEKEQFEIERILRSRGKGKNKKVFVKWKGYPDSFNTWEPANSVVDLI